MSPRARPTAPSRTSTTPSRSTRAIRSRSTTAASPIATRARPRRRSTTTIRPSRSIRSSRWRTTIAAMPTTTAATTTARSRTTTRRSRSIRTTRWPTTIAASSITTATTTTARCRSEQGDRARSEGFARLLQSRPDLSRQGRDGQGARRLRPVHQARPEEPAAVLQPRPGRIATRASWSAPSPTSATSIRLDARNALAFYNRGLAYWDRRETRPRGAGLRAGDPHQSRLCAGLLQPRPRATTRSATTTAPSWT